MSSVTVDKGIMFVVESIFQADNGSTPLLLGCQEGQHNIVEFLANQGADVDHCDIVGTTPILAAVQRGHRQVVNLLVKKGVDVNTPTCTSPSRPLLHVATRLGNLGMVVNLLDLGADINAVSEDNRATVLHEAALRGHMVC